MSKQISLKIAFLNGNSMSRRDVIQSYIKAS